MPGVEVVIEDTPLKTTTNATGRYAFKKVPAGTYNITARGERLLPPAHEGGRDRRHLAAAVA